jgi:hypothetical protein
LRRVSQRHHLCVRRWILIDFSAILATTYDLTFEYQYATHRNVVMVRRATRRVERESHELAVVPLCNHLTTTSFSTLGCTQHSFDATYTVGSN